MTKKKVNPPFVPGEDMLSSQRLQALYSNSHSREILKEAKRISMQQQKEHAPLLAAFKARQKE